MVDDGAGEVELARLSAGGVGDDAAAADDGDGGGGRRLVENDDEENSMSCWQGVSLFLAFTTILFAILFSLAGGDVVFKERTPKTVDPVTGDVDDFVVELDLNLFGQWEAVVPEDNGAALGSSLGMQSVHTILLPSGRILTAPGSSWRNWDHITEYYPEVNPINLTTGAGLFDRSEDPFANTTLEWYYSAVNNVAIYDPRTNEWFRIPHPVPEPHPENASQFKPSDLFCSGQLHLPNGNPLFLGGTQYYSPFRTGNDATYIFDWVREAEKDWETVDWRGIPDDDDNMWTFSGA